MNILHSKRSRTDVALGRGLAASRWLAFLLAVTVLVFARRAAPAQQSSPTPRNTASSGNAQNGKKIFASDGCYTCHGREGQGSTATGASRSIGPPQLPLEAFVHYVRQPTNAMPPYTSKAVSDQDLADIYAFLKTIPPPPKGKDIPLLNK